jgi:hypothetical protein
MNSMDGSQYALTKSLVEDQSVYLEDYKSLAWPDVATGRDGRIVSDREPGQAVIAMPFYAVADLLDPLLVRPYDGSRPSVTPEAKTQVITYTSLIFVVSLGLSYIYVLLRRLGASNSSALFTCVLICFGTLMWKYSASFVRQPAVGIFLALAVLLALSYRQERRRTDALLMGACAGLAISHDYMMVVPLSLLGIAFVLLERPSKAAMLCGAAGAAPFAVLILVYNYAAFGELIVSPHDREVVFVHMKEFSSNFRTPIHEGLYLNLLSFNPIPESAVSWVLTRPEIAHQNGVAWAMKHSYKGLLVQSPFLWLALLGWIITGRKFGIGLLYPGSVVLSWLLLMSSYTLFWSPNTYDGRYVLPIVVTIGAGTAFFWDWAMLKSRGWQRNTWLFTFGLAALISLYFAWESAATNFAPNVSGEHRWFPSHLFTESGVTAGRLRDGLFETFPNVYNAYVLIPLAIVLYGAAYLIYGSIRAYPRWSSVGFSTVRGYPRGEQHRFPQIATLPARRNLRSLSLTAGAALIATGLALLAVSMN